MKVTTERLEDCRVKMIVELDAAEVDKKLRQTARELARQFNVPGYRRGRAPFHAVIRVFGREAVQQQALDDFGNELYEQALEEIEYEPYAVGELEEVEWEPFRMTVMLPIQPEVDLGDYRSVRVPFEVEEVTEERIEDYLAGIQQEHAQWVPVERGAALGDQVVLDMVATVGETEIMNNEGYETILEAGATHPLAGFHEQIVGMSPGEEKTFVLPVPQGDPEEEAAGQEASVTARLHSVKEEDVPPLDDELALMVGDYDTLADLKAGVQQRLETEAQQRAQSQYLEKVLEAFVGAAAKVEYPAQAVDREAELSLNQMERNLASSGLQLDTYLSIVGKTREAYKRELHPVAEQRLKKRLVLAEIAKQEGLSIEEEEIGAELERMRESLGAQGEQVMELFSSPEGRMMVADDLLTIKAEERARQIAKGEAPPSEAEAGAPEAAEDQGEAATETVTGGEMEVESEAAQEGEAQGEAEAEGEAELQTTEPESGGSRAGNE